MRIIQQRPISSFLLSLLILAISSPRKRPFFLLLVEEEKEFHFEGGRGREGRQHEREKREGEKKQQQKHTPQPLTASDSLILLETAATTSTRRARRLRRFVPLLFFDFLCNFFKSKRKKGKKNSPLSLSHSLSSSTFCFGNSQF